MNNLKNSHLASIEKPWMKYYPEELQNIELPTMSICDYITSKQHDLNDMAIQYYGVSFSWNEILTMKNKIAKSLIAYGIEPYDQIGVFLKATPEFIALFLAAEQVGASLICRDGTIEENAFAVRQGEAKLVFIPDYISFKEEIAMRNVPYVTTLVKVPSFYKKAQYKVPSHSSNTYKKLFDGYDFNSEKNNSI